MINIVKNFNTITLRIRYKPKTKLYEFNISTDEKNLSYEEIAWKFAEILTGNYIKSLGGEKDKKFERRYKLGQYKMIKNYLEAKL